jgi:uncharacterized protein (DUF952 family)
VKYILISFSLLSLNIFASGKYSNSNIYIVCDFPKAGYFEYIVNGYFENPSLLEEGFIHCAKPSQLEYVMNKYFKADTYILLVSTRNLLGSRLVYEGINPANLYPHLYRRFFKEDSIAEILVTRSLDGNFILPSEFR